MKKVGFYVDLNIKTLNIGIIDISYNKPALNEWRKSVRARVRISESYIRNSKKQNSLHSEDETHIA